MQRKKRAFGRIIKHFINLNKVYSDSAELDFYIKPLEFKISISAESYDKKSLKINEIATLPKMHSFEDRSQILIAQIEDLNEDCVKISRLYFLFFQRYKPS